jgi:hypothetical protein
VNAAKAPGNEERLDHQTKVLATVFAAHFAGACTPASRTPGRARPDIIVFIVDDQNDESILGRE